MVKTPEQYIYIYIYIYIYRERDTYFSNFMHAEPPFPCDCVTPGNSHCKRVMTSTAESKRVFCFFFFKSQTAH